jgi:hypothetical protein
MLLEVNLDAAVLTFRRLVGGQSEALVSQIGFGDAQPVDVTRRQ